MAADSDTTDPDVVLIASRGGGESLSSRSGVPIGSLGLKEKSWVSPPEKIEFRALNANIYNEYIYYN